MRRARRYGDVRRGGPGLRARLAAPRSAVGFLTRIPTGGARFGAAELSRAALFFPAVGLLVGGVAAGVRGLAELALPAAGACPRRAAGITPGVSSLTPAEHRGLRELAIAVAHLARHWGSLGARVGEPALAAGAGAARSLLVELEAVAAVRGIETFPVAAGSGGVLAALRNAAGDPLLERNQALRAAVLDVQHVVTLHGYLAALADSRGDGELAGLHRSWEARMREAEDAARAAAVAAGRDPERAVAPAEAGPVGRAGHSVAYALGALGEAFDTSPAGALARRLRRR